MGYEKCGEPVTGKERRRIVMLLETGMTVVSISEVTLRSRATVYSIKKSSGDIMGDTPQVKFVRLSGVMLPEPVSKLLAKAAERRQMEASDLAAQLLGGIVMRGSVDRTQQKWFGYQNDRRLDSRDSHGPKKVSKHGSSALLRAQV
jgi:hypothetical protein